MNRRNRAEASCTPRRIAGLKYGRRGGRPSRYFAAHYILRVDYPLEGYRLDVRWCCAGIGTLPLQYIRFMPGRIAGLECGRRGGRPSRAAHRIAIHEWTLYWRDIVSMSAGVVRASRRCPSSISACTPAMRIAGEHPARYGFCSQPAAPTGSASLVDLTE